MKAGIVAAVLFLFSPAIAQSNNHEDPDQEHKDKNGRPSRDIIEQERFAAARLTLSYNTMNLDLKDRKYAERATRYVRDAGLYTGAFAYYRNFGLGSRVGVMDIKNPGYKKIENYYLTLNYFSRAFGVEIYYNRLGRFNISDSPYGVGKMWNVLRKGSHMKYESAGLDLYLFMEDLLSLNKMYSYGAAFEQSEKQEKSGGTFFFKLAGDYIRMRNNRPIIPYQEHELLMYMRLYGLKGWMFGGFSFGVGFAYTIVLPADFFISMYISLMVRPLQKEFYALTGTKREFRIDSLKGKGKISAGYNGGPFFAGICLVYEGIMTPCYRFKAEMWSGDLAVEFFSGVRM